MMFKSRRNLAIFLAGVVAIPTSLALETYIARSYYDVATQRLRILGANAVRSGAAYLPSNPQLAAQVADKVANQSGVAQEEIVATSVSEDGLGLTIRFEEKVPWHIAMFAFGQPKTIGVEATAQVSVRKSMAI